ncbi:glutamate synthase, partial [Biomphalaria glabrata]
QMKPDLISQGHYIPPHVASRLLQWCNQPGNFYFHPAYEIIAEPIQVRQKVLLPLFSYGPPYYAPFT